MRAASALQQHFSGTTVDAARASSQPNRLIGRVGNITGSKEGARRHDGVQVVEAGLLRVGARIRRAAAEPSMKRCEWTWRCEFGWCIISRSVHNASWRLRRAWDRPKQIAQVATQSLMCKTSQEYSKTTIIRVGLTRPLCHSPIPRVSPLVVPNIFVRHHVCVCSSLH